MMKGRAEIRMRVHCATNALWTQERAEVVGEQLQIRLECI